MAKWICEERLAGRCNLTRFHHCEPHVIKLILCWNYTKCCEKPYKVRCIIDPRPEVSNG